MDTKLRLKLLFELGGAEIAQRRMAPLAVIPAFKVSKDSVFRLSSCVIMLAIDEFGFESPPKAFYGGIIITTTNATEAG